MNCFKSFFGNDQIETMLDFCLQKFFSYEVIYLDFEYLWKPWPNFLMVFFQFYWIPGFFILENFPQNFGSMRPIYHSFIQR